MDAEVKGMDTEPKSGGSLRKVLIESGLVTTKQLKELDQTSGSAKLGQLLVERQIITAQELAMVMGLQLEYALRQSQHLSDSA